MEAPDENPQRIQQKRRTCEEKEGLDLSFVCKADNLDQVAQVQTQVTALSEKTRLSIIDQPDLVI